MIKSMRRLHCILLLLFSLTALYSAVYPVDSVAGAVSAAEEGSAEAVLLAPFRKEYSLDWIDTYVKEELKSTFSLSYSDVLLEMLPLANPIVSRFENGKVNIKDTVTGALITVYADEELKITALGIR